MARNTDKFIEKLNDFTNALEDLVDILGEQAKSNPTEILNQLADSLDGGVMNTIAEDVSKIKKDVTSINSNTKNILKAVKDQNKSKETGMFGQIEEKSNKDKIIGAVGTVVLIAAGVLAIGMAFKIVGDVSLTSVVGLSLGILFTAEAFVKIASLRDDKGKPMTIKRSLTVSLIMITMSAGLLIAGKVLSYMPNLSINNIISIIGVGLGVGIASYLLLKSLGKLKPKELLLAMVAPIIFPLIAYSIVWSAEILKDIVEVDFFKIVGTSVAIGLAIIAIIPAFIVVAKFKMGITDTLVGGAAIVIISIAIALSSYILDYGKYDGNKPSWEWALGVGLSIIAFSIPMAIVGAIAMTGVGLPALALAMLAIPIVVLTMVGASLILPKGTYDIYPNWKWSLGVGLSLLAFSVPMLALGLMITASFGLGLVVLGAGLGGVLLIADAIQQASHILGKGNYSVYPGIEWAGGVGGSIMAFATAMVIQSGLGIISKFTGGDSDLSAFIIKISKAIITAGEEFSKSGDYWKKGSYPGIEWAGGVGGSIMAFASAMESQAKSGLIGSITSLLGGGDDDNSILNIVKGIVSIGLEFKTNSDKHPNLWNLDNVPGPDWTKSLKDILDIFNNVNNTQVDDIVNTLSRFAKIKWNNLSELGLVSLAIKDLSESLNNFDVDKIDSFAKIGAGFQILSLVDSDGLEDVLKVMEEKNNVISEILDPTGFTRGLLDNIFSGGNTKSSKSDTSSNNTGGIAVKYSPFESELLTHIENIDFNISTFVDEKNIDAEDSNKQEDLQPGEVGSH